ncbi:hypothetical protein [Bradyrhizobium monzae]
MAEIMAATELALDDFIESSTPKRAKAANPEQGPGHSTGVLRLPGRAQEAPADDLSH